ncbi:hypothetical protein JZO81_15445 [Enterococcus hulanensis]|uniref:hypothetical protein n=1 Tax=Enterococcus TaxID=1350 RepID=UPI000B5A5B1A|nr:MULTISPECIES: hypothetical protein [Enterococcus]MBO0412463.1 hypothetical protein [Enterococcus hulanensis]OTO15151.1 hypothetical protein A5875_004308 [Enterococcus sp. 3H8_DIV0648]
MDLDKYWDFSSKVNNLSNKISGYRKRKESLEKMDSISVLSKNGEFSFDRVDIGKTTALSINDSAVESFKVLAIKHFEDLIDRSEKELRELTKGMID